MKKWIFFITVSGLTLGAWGQKTYAPTSVLASGKWIKLSVSERGIYRITSEFLKNAGVSGTLPSSTLRLFGTGGRELPEDNALPSPDDLIECATWVSDGGDGVLDGNDYIAFYAPGPHHWEYDSSARRHTYIKNHYSDKSFYYIQVAGSNSKKIISRTVLNSVVAPVQSFDEFYHYELDSINFLNSGKEWYGEEMSNQPGKTAAIDISLPVPTVLQGSPYYLRSEVVGRSFQSPNRILVQVNGANVAEHSTPVLQGTLIESFANSSFAVAEGNLSSTSITVGYRFLGQGSSAQAWLNKFDVYFRRKLDMNGSSQLFFRDISSISKSIVKFRIENVQPEFRVWDVTHAQQPIAVPGSLIGSALEVVDDAIQLKEYVCFDPRQLKSPRFEGNVENQDLHASSDAEMIIVVDRSMLSQAQRLAQLHTAKDGLKVLTVTTDKIWNEFSGGSPDPSAIRNFVKMFFDRAGSDAARKPKYLLLFGGASYDFKGKSGKSLGLVPSYQSNFSLDPLATYVTDDYFGYLEDQESIARNFPQATLDIAIGRIPARTLGQAKLAVDKIFYYIDSTDRGSWKNNITLLADDEDYNLHLNDAELHARLIADRFPSWNIQKIYLDAFTQTGGTGGSRYPEVNNLINRDLNRGTLVWNYSGHGSSSRLAQEVILEREMFAEWNNAKRLPLFVTATCDFAPFDNPANLSIGEELFIGRSNGAIGLVTTTRLVFASSNRVINNDFLQFLFQKDARGRYASLGESLRRSKNYTVLNSGDLVNIRKFVLLGDPALKLAIPEHTVTTTTLNGKPIAGSTDTLKANNAYTIAGEIRNPDGSIDNAFNGFIYPKVFDKPVSISTLANDPTSLVIPFKSDENLIYSGKVAVTNGTFSFSMVVPSDLDFAYGIGRINYYADGGSKEAQGTYDRLAIGGWGGQVTNDNKGPQIKAWLNSEQFINGGKVRENSTLLVQLSDAQGIYIGSSGIGRAITAVLDDRFAEAIVLNDQFEPTKGNTEGRIAYPLTNVKEGKHTLRIKAWDVLNNASEYVLEFEVITLSQVDIESVSVYPNPTQGSVTLIALLDGPTSGARITLEVVSSAGKLVHRSERQLNQSGLRSVKMEWTGTMQNGARLSPGVYFCRFIVRSPSGIETTRSQKLVIL